MVKIRLLGVGKFERYVHYILSKEQVFFKIVRALVGEFDRDYEYEIGYYYNQKEREYDPKKEMDIKTFTDQRWSAETEDYIVEFIYGKDKIFLSVFTRKDDQDKISKIINPFIKGI